MTAETDGEAHENDPRPTPLLKVPQHRDTADAGQNLEQSPQHRDPPGLDQATQRHLHADEEQQQHHPKVSDPREQQLVGEDPEAVGTESDAREQIGDRQRQAQPAEAESQQEQDEGGGDEAGQEWIQVHRCSPPSLPPAPRRWPVGRG